MYSGTVGAAETDFRAEASITGDGDVFHLNLGINERAARLRLSAISDQGNARSFEAIGHFAPDSVSAWTFSGSGTGVSLASPDYVTIGIFGSAPGETWRAWLELSFTQNYSGDVP